MFYTSEIGFQHLCESAFVGLCKIVGTSKHVAIRRETADIKEIMARRVADNDDLMRMESGSQREGFRLEGSDMDFMFWRNTHRVIRDTFQSHYYYTTKKTLIRSNSSQSLPGFTLLELLTPTTDRKIQSACVPINYRLYVSSSQFRKQTQIHFFTDSTQHGPCESGEVLGKEYDLVFCFSYDFWPPSASSWIDRCHLGLTMKSLIP